MPIVLRTEYSVLHTDFGVGPLDLWTFRDPGVVGGRSIISATLRSKKLSLIHI